MIQEHSVEEYSVEEDAIGGNAVVEHPVKEHPVKEHPDEKHPVEEHPVEEHPVEEHPVEEHPVEELPVEELPVEEHPVEELPVEELPVDYFIPDRGAQLCKVASSLREGTSCCLGPHHVGGFNVVFEVVFEDQVCWLARIPLQENCYQPEEITLSYAATLKYLKMHTTIPVPHVYGYAVRSNRSNATGVSYIFMEKMGGQPLPEFERLDLEPNACDLALVKKVHQQLTDVILELASLKFDKIGTLREDPDGDFFVAEYSDMYTAYPEERASAYNKLRKNKKGPFSSISEFYDAMSDLNDLSVQEDPKSHDEEETDKELEVLQYKQLREMASNFIVDSFNNGPFVINHDDLTIQNILVDDDFNITGIIDFPGTVTPLPSLCMYPWLFRDNLAGLMTDRDIYLDIFLNRDAQHGSSALASKPVREQLMRDALERQDFELGLMKPYAALVVPQLLKYVNEKNDIKAIDK